VKMFDAGKTRMIGLPYGEKNCDDMLNRLHLILERNGQLTDGRTDGRTDSMLTRDKNRGFRQILLETVLKRFIQLARSIT